MDEVGISRRLRSMFDTHTSKKIKEAKTLEQTRLEAYRCWRRLTPEEELQWKDGLIKALRNKLSYCLISLESTLRSVSVCGVRP